MKKVNKKTDMKPKIIRTLSRHPEGLTIQNLADEIKVSRHTIIRYLSELVGEGLVYRRKVGSATLHYLKDVSGKANSEKVFAKGK